MARKKAPEKPANHERWLVSYADFITLLFAVFVTLYAMSQTDKKKVDIVAASYRSAFGVTAGGSPSSQNIINSSQVLPIPGIESLNQQNSARKMNRGDSAGKSGNNAQKKSQASAKELQKIKSSIGLILKHLQVEDMAEVTASSKGLIIRLEEAGLFESGKANISSKASALLAKIAAILAAYDNHIRIEGHTDTTPLISSSYRSNLELSSARANTVAQFFLDNYDFLPSNISISGYGEYRPIADNSTEEGRKKNRRVDIVIYGAGNQTEAP